MQCQLLLVQWLSWGMILAGVLHFLCFQKSHAAYGRYLGASSSSWMVPARLAWFIQELPALLLPMLLLLTTSDSHPTGRYLLLSTFCLHYFQRTCIYSLLTRGRPYPFNIMVSGITFCSVNGFLQAHHLLHCLTYPQGHMSDGRRVIGLVIFFIGMAINIHSDHILRNLRKPGETLYKIPRDTISKVKKHLVEQIRQIENAEVDAELMVDKVPAWLVKTRGSALLAALHMGNKMWSAF
ncbi:hypothetical protein NFI96_014091 [Prochilodus magdalenae]|nr:hypothetical protein NFI96_014091 [Prochilodus magdalenae]